MIAEKQLLLDVKDLKVHFSIASKSAWPWSKPANLKAVDGVNIQLYEGETLGVVGESGCGKSTFARAIIGLVESTDGEVVWLGQDLTKMQDVQRRETRKEIQMIFQDPLASLNPRMTVGDIIAEPLKTFYPNLTKEEVKSRVKEMMAKVGLLPNVINRYPHEFSGGQCQRIGIARALILRPKMIICDEPVSALDVAVQAQILNLLKSLQAQFGLTYLFISHDLGVVQHMCDDIAVMYMGQFMEYANRESFFAAPRHPYSEALLDAVPTIEVGAQAAGGKLVDGAIPDLTKPQTGCRFASRCPHAVSGCEDGVPKLDIWPGTSDHHLACYRAAEFAAS